jgi:cullin 1
LHFFAYIQSKDQKLTGAILRLIERERNGRDIDHGLVKKVVESFMTLGIDQNDLKRVSLDVYEKHFEMPFLEATEKYYKLKAEAFLASNSRPDYLKKAEKWKLEEADRVERYLNTHTREPILKQMRACTYQR